MSKPAAIIGARQLFLLPSIVIAAAIVCGLQAEDSWSNDCDGQRLNVLTARRGLIRSPNFPKRFPVPIHCRWLIDASASFDSAIIYVYFTQLFVTSGLSITEYPYFDVESRTGFYGKQIFNAAQDNVLRYEFSRTNCTYLLIDFQLDVLEGNHLRVLYHLMDVYGFNITYEITRDEPSEKRCTVSDCSLVGHCYANQNFSSYGCSCFPGFFGENCGYGPLCQPDMNSCENGATCRYAGETTVICQCTEGFTGSKCDTPIRNTSGFGCTTTVAEECTLQCRYDENDDVSKNSDELPCSCRNRTVLEENSGDTAMYLLTLHLSNLTSILEKPSSVMVHNGSDAAAASTRSGDLLQHHRQYQQHAMYTKIQYEIGKYMKKAKLSKIENIEITDVIKENSHGATVSLRIFASKEDRSKLKETINQMAEKSIISSSYNISQLPALRLVKISTNIKDNSVLEGEEFIISCTAEGTSNISFQLYKDNVPIAISIANRGMWSHIVPQHNNRYTMMLAIEHADIYDSGLYTCQVKDNGFEHCHSITVSILQLPRIKLNPLSITTEKGQNLSIKCLSINEFHNGIKFGYTWLRNDNLMKASIPELYWEDLYRGGSVLYINNIQNSDTFRCNVQAIGSQTATVYIDVLNKTETVYCEKDGSWPATSAGVVALQECPENYSDDSISRLCLMTDSHSAQWQLPDYSKCVSNNFSIATQNFRSLLLGYENASITASATLLSIEKFLRDRSSGGFFPGEGEPIVTFLQSIYSYLAKSTKFTDLMNAKSSFYNIIDLVLSDPLAVVNTNLIFNLSELIRKWTSFWLIYETALNKKSNISDDSANILNLTSFTLFFPKYFGQVLKFAEDLRIKVENSAAKKSLNYSTNTAIIVYRNLSHRLVSQFVSHPWKKENLLFEIKSPVINVIHNGRTKYEDKINQSTFIEVQYKLPTVKKNRDNSVNLNICCGQAHHFGQSWKLLSCQSTSEITSSGTVSCSYEAAEGLIAIYAAEVPVEESDTVNCTYHVMVVGGCVVCFVQCALTLGVLIPRWYKIRSCLTYLKMQVCISIASSMMLFLFASCNAQPVLYPYILFGLQVFLLAAISSHISVLIIIYLDVISLSKIPKIKVSAIVVMTVSPTLLAVFAPLSRQITNERLTCWWLCRSTLLLYIHSLVGLFLLVLFMFLYYSVIKKLWFLLNVSKSERKTLIDRASFVQCTLLIFLTTAVVAMSSTVYVNSNTSVSQCVFGSSSVLLGFLVAISYIPKNETLFCGRIYPKMTAYNDKINDKYSPELQIISTTAADVGYKQDNCIDDTSSSECSSHLEIKNERNSIHRNSYRLHKNRSNRDSTIGLIKSPLLNNRLKNENDVALKRHHETESHHETTQQEKPDILLPVTCNNYVNPAICNAVNSFHNPLTQCMSDNDDVKNSSPEMLTTRLCVELGVMKSSLHENANKINDGTTDHGGGTLLICSVDVEPCPGHVIELNEVKFTTAINAAVATATPVPADKQEQTTLPNKSSFSPSTIGDNCNRTDGAKDVLDRISQDLDYLLNNKNSDNESKLK